MQPVPNTDAPAVDINPQRAVLAMFQAAGDLQPWRVFSDAAFGGSSRVTVRLEEEEQPKVGWRLAANSGKLVLPLQYAERISGTVLQHAVFEGRYSKVLGEGSELVRSGYVGMSTLVSHNSQKVEFSRWQALAQRQQCH